MNIIHSVKRKIGLVLNYLFGGWNWGFAFQMTFFALFVIMVIANGFSGGGENSPYP